MNASDHLLPRLDERRAQRILGVLGDGIKDHAGTGMAYYARDPKLRRGNDGSDASHLMQASPKAWWAEISAILRGKRG